jgi:hypothetical protein
MFVKYYLSRSVGQAAAIGGGSNNQYLVPFELPATIGIRATQSWWL